MEALGGLPRADLGPWPTPLQEAPRLTAILGGPRILVKRDDASALGLGGNKVRKLEYLLGHALTLGCRAVITTGAHTSNHARLTAAACRRLGLEPHLVLRSAEARPPVQGNLLVDHLLGAAVHLVAPDGPAALAAMADLAERLRGAGVMPYVVPTGGSVGRGAVGYAHAVAETVLQAAAIGTRPDVFVTASGSGGTQAGLLLGCRLYCPAAEVVGVMVGGDDPAAFADRTARLLSEAAGRIGIGPTPPPEEWGPRVPAGLDEGAPAGAAAAAEAGVRLCAGYVGAGYGDITPAVREAIDLAARSEGLLLDPVYSGKAMAGLIGEVRAGRFGRGQTVVFVHTGGQPGLFARAAELAEAPGG